MEVLSPHFIDVALRVAVALSFLSLATLLIIVAVRLAAERRISHTTHFRRTAAPFVTSYMAGRTPMQEVVAVLQADPCEALTLLMEVSDQLEPATRAKLRPLFAELPLVRNETAKLSQRRWEARMNAAERLGYLADPHSTGPLLSALKDKVLAVRFSAARALAAIGEPDSIELILLAFDVPGEMNQRRVAEVLYAFGPPAADPLLAVVENTGNKFSDTVVGVAARVLGMLRVQKAVPYLKPLLQTPEFRVRLAAARALGQIGDRSVLAELGELAGDPSWEVRNTVVQALGKLQAVQQIPLLADALGDQNWWVRFSAGQALYSLGNDGINVLRTAMLSSSDRYAGDMSRQILEEHRISETREKHP